MDFNQLFTDYEKFRENKLNSDRIVHTDVVNLVRSISQNKLFKIEELGKSVEKREIFSIVFGNGKIKVLVWSQMHGDEPTATAALFDLLNFFISSDSFNGFRENLLSKITFHFIPMVNPDGAERFQRENAFNIDLNRDTLRLESPESKILWDYAEKLKPEFGFNLHDQNSYYTAGRTNNTSAISLLAPPINYSKSINLTREKSMQVICKIREALSLFIPQNIARYSDDFEPRAFGDNFTKIGISSVLIESGFYKGDEKKEFVRKLNFVALLSAFNSIAEKDFEKIDHNNYFEIPENQQMLFDFLLRNLTLFFNGKSYKIDIGINRDKYWNMTENKFSFKSKIADLGDLSIYHGLEEHDFNRYEILPVGKIAVDEPADFDLTFDGKESIKVRNGFII